MTALVNPLPDLPDPLVPPDVDLRGLPYMPLYGKQLLESDFYAIATADEFRAGITLWINSWSQHPGASVPNDDRVLCSLAGMGRDLRGWRKVRDVALHGFVLCSDDRWYHRFNAENAVSAWKLRESYRARGKKGGESKPSSATSSASAQPKPTQSPALPGNRTEQKGSPIRRSLPSPIDLASKRDGPPPPLEATAPHPPSADVAEAEEATIPISALHAKLAEVGAAAEAKKRTADQERIASRTRKDDERRELFRRQEEELRERVRPST